MFTPKRFNVRQAFLCILITSSAALAKRDLPPQSRTDYYKTPCTINGFASWCAVPWGKWTVGLRAPLFSTLWRDNLTGFFQTSVDPQEQLKRFQTERRQICAYAKSMAFQGAGYGSFSRHCELGLNQALRDQLKP